MTNAALLVVVLFGALFAAWVVIRWAETGREIDDVIAELDEMRDERND